MQGRINSFHLKDILKKNVPECRNTVFGEGEGDFAKVLKELKRLGYRGITAIDFEHDTPASKKTWSGMSPLSRIRRRVC